MNIILHQANGLEIGQRREDGYINATAMCVAYKKDISDWLKTDNAWELVVALAEKIQVQPVQIKSHKSGNSVFTRVSATYPTLIIVKRGSPSSGGGTWVHYKLAVPLAMWISAEFALLVSDWVEHWLTTYQNPIEQSIPSSLSAAAKAYIESSQALNRTIHTAIHQQTDSLREALKFLESKDNLTVGEELEPEQIEQIPESTNTVSIDLIKFRDNQPRHHFDEQKLLKLSGSIKEFGILQPILVRPLDNGEYELIAGERRLRAAHLAGQTSVPIVVKEFSDKQALSVSILENLQREDLNPVEEVEAILELLAINLDVEPFEVITILNKVENSRKRNLKLTEKVLSQLEQIESTLALVGRFNASSFRTTRIPLLNLPQDVLTPLREMKLDYTKARLIGQVKNLESRTGVLNKAINEDLSFTQIKELIEPLKNQKPKKEAAPEKILIQRFIDIGKLLKESEALFDASKRKKIEKILRDLQKLLTSPEEESTAEKKSMHT
jgi:ParB family transcriptional regulator, chromosome partitioning protein